MKSSQICILFFLLFLCSRSVSAYLATDGQNFVDSKGNEVFLKGVGLGGWLVPEGYMLHIPGFGSPTSIKNMISDLIGTENTQEFYQIYRENYVREKDIRILSEMGFNSIRLPFNYRMLSPEDQPGVYMEEGFAIIDSLVKWCETYQLYLILDMHCAPGGQNDGNISDSDGIEARLWTEPSNQRRTAKIWKKIAERYVGEEIIAGYDLLNEPVLPSGYDGDDLRNLYVEITDSIRLVDQDHIIFIEGNTYATNFSGLEPAWDNNLSYSFHKYWNDTNYASIESYILIRARTNTPLWMGESGENSNHWFAETVHLLENNNVNWCWWTHKKIATTTSPYSATITDAYKIILDYWNGEGTKPTVEFAKNALFDMAEKLNIDNCEYHPDVVAALTEPEFRTMSKAAKSHVIPGTINMVDYDFGNNGIGYNDTDYEKTRWDADQPWNNGGEYRNDGVDIERSEDTNDPLFSVGWAETGEWLKYTVNVKQNDLYDITFRVASLSGGGEIRVLVDETILLSSVSVPETGGWYNWQNITVNDLSLSQGIHKIKVVIKNEGFNISQMRFEGQSTNINTGRINQQPNDFFLGQNYPNPFNGFTRIPFKAKTDVNIYIVDNCGRMIRSIFHPDNEWVIWDGCDQSGNEVSSGIYFYSIKSGKHSVTKKMLYIQ
jgi:endoglucanase